MVVCRYYANGFCRFGESCRFEHVNDDSRHQNYYSQTRNSDNYHWRSSNQPSPNTANFDFNGRLSSYNKRAAAASFDFSAAPSDDRLDTRHQAASNFDFNARLGGYDRHQTNYQVVDNTHNRFGNTASYRDQHASYDQRTGTPPNRQYYRDQPANANYSNRYVVDNASTYSNHGNFTAQTEPHNWTQHQPISNERRDVNLSSSTITGKSTKFDFNSKLKEVQEPSLDGGNPGVKVVVEDLRNWLHGNQYLHSCYGPQPHVAACSTFFEDNSPDELRWTAQQTNVDQYIHFFGQKTEQIKSTIQRLIETPHLVLMPSNLKALEIPTNNEVIRHIETQPQTKKEDIVDETHNNNKKREEIKEDTTTSGVVTPGMTSSTYTPIQELTQEELEAFQADRFTLSSIPIRPPPLELCR